MRASLSGLAQGAIEPREVANSILAGARNCQGVPWIASGGGGPADHIVDTCDNPVVGKHLGGNTRLLAEILLLSTMCIPISVSLFSLRYL